MKGDIPISGSKNAVLPLMAASLLSSEPLFLSRVPDLQDVHSLRALLTQMGCHITYHRASGEMELRAKGDIRGEAPYEYVRKMRASILVLGALLGRCGYGKVSLPGGCAIGARPVDLHLQGMQALGAAITLEEGMVVARAPAGGLPGGKYKFDKKTVTGTANVLMAACLSKGESFLENTAQEPEILSLIACLQSMGASIESQGENLHITGRPSLSGSHWEVMADRIELGSYLIAAGITGSNLTLSGGNLDLLPSFVETLSAMGMVLSQAGDKIHVQTPQLLGAAHIETAPFPGFPTDLQAQIMVLMTQAQGVSTVTESIFENRFMHVAELKRMGADIEVQGRTATIHGGKPLTGAPVMATDLRASFALVLGGLVAQGKTTLRRVYHLDRGYENLEEKLQGCGAKLARAPENGEF